MLSKFFYKLRIPLLTEVIARLYIRLLQVHFHWCIADSVSEVLPKNPTSLHARCVCVYHLNRCKTSYGFSLICRGWMHGLAVIHQRRHCLSMVISIWDARSTYLPICRSVSTVDQAVTLRCFESTRLPQSVLHASEPSSDFRRNHIADSIMIF